MNPEIETVREDAAKRLARVAGHANSQKRKAATHVRNPTAQAESLFRQAHLTRLN